MELSREVKRMEDCIVTINFKGGKENENTK